MLLLKTILIFLKNKQKELGIINKIIVIIQLCLIGFSICSVLALIGYVTLLLFPNMHANSLLQNFRLTINAVTFWFLCFTGFMSLLIILLGCGAIGVLYFLIRYGLPAVFSNLYRWAPHAVKEFKWFIVMNWRIAKLQSGIEKKYLIEFTQKDGSLGYLLKVGYGYTIKEKKLVVKDLIRGGFLNYAMYYFFNEEFANCIFECDKEFISYAKTKKLKWENYRCVPVSKFCKENKI